MISKGACYVFGKKLRQKSISSAKESMVHDIYSLFVNGLGPLIQMSFWQSALRVLKGEMLNIPELFQPVTWNAKLVRASSAFG